MTSVIDRFGAEAPGTERGAPRSRTVSFLRRTDRSARPSFDPSSKLLLVALSVPEHDRVRDRIGVRAIHDLQTQVAAAFTALLPGSQLMEQGHSGRMFFTVPGGVARAEQRLGRARAGLAARTFNIAGEHTRVNPMIGYTLANSADLSTLIRRAEEALAQAVNRMDLVPVVWDPKMSAPHRPARAGGIRSRLRTPLQVLATFTVGLGLPYSLYVVAAAFGRGPTVTGVVYLVLTAILLITAIVINIEGVLALSPIRPPAADDGALPAASAIIAAFLPNESATIVDTVETFLNLAYDGPLQVILAYNTPMPLSIEATLAEIAARDSRFVLLPITHSTSKAQNVNAALEAVTGEIVGIFDADHHPQQGSFQRAWQWLANGYGVVQGHCLIRNGNASWVSRMVAVEFESIYAVSHPGRAQLHGFGIFGGSNGYWRTDLLREVRLRGTMLTEDIDSSLRVILRGERIASDPGLISRELAPTRLGVLAGQRLRWAQGWSQVSLEYVRSALRSPRLSRRQKAGMFFLLAWREAYPWVSIQMWPLLLFVMTHPELEHANWTAPLLLLSTLITTSVGPAQAVMAYRLAAPEIRQHRRWFLGYAVLNALFYTEFKNTIARAGHLKQLLGESVWRVTDRSVTETDEPAAPAVAGAALAARSE